MSGVQLGRYDNSWFHPGGTPLRRALWFLVGLPMLRSHVVPFSGLRVRLLRLFGARIGRGVVVKTGVNVKYPWHLEVGNDTWLGEDCWIDCLTTVRIGSNCCVSQGAYLCTGNHDWSDPAFGLMIAPVTMGDGSWAGARSVLLPGSVLGEGAVAGAGAVVGGTVPPYEIHAGNPAVFVRKRRLRTGEERVAVEALERHATV